MVIWSDETKINCFGSDGRRKIWIDEAKKKSKHTSKQTAKFSGGSLMLWGCMSWDGVGRACKIDGRMDSEFYF